MRLALTPLMAPDFNLRPVALQGLCLFAMQRLPESSSLLSAYLEKAPDAEDAERVRGLLQRMRKQASDAQSARRSDEDGAGGSDAG
eukprot:363353-Chlamydomonas_euryale.AAC.6